MKSVERTRHEKSYDSLNYLQCEEELKQKKKELNELKININEFKNACNFLKVVRQCKKVNGKYTYQSNFNIEQVHIDIREKLIIALEYFLFPEIMPTITRLKELRKDLESCYFIASQSAQKFDDIVIMTPSGTQVAASDDSYATTLADNAPPMTNGVYFNAELKCGAIFHESSETVHDEAVDLYSQLSRALGTFFKHYSSIFEIVRDYHGVNAADLNERLKSLFSVIDNGAEEVTEKLFNLLFTAYPINQDRELKSAIACEFLIDAQIVYLPKRMNKLYEPVKKYVEEKAVIKCGGDPSNIYAELFERFKHELTVVLLRNDLPMAFEAYQNLHPGKDPYLEESAYYKMLYAQYVQLNEIYNKLVAYERHLIISELPLTDKASKALKQSSATFRGSFRINSIDLEEDANDDNSTLIKPESYKIAEQEVEDILIMDDVARLDLIKPGLREKLYIKAKLHDIMFNPLFPSATEIMTSIKSFFAEKHVMPIVGARRDTFIESHSEALQSAIMAIIEGKKDQCIKSSTPPPSPPMSGSSTPYLESPSNSANSFELPLCEKDLKEILKEILNYQSYLIGTVASIAEKLYISPHKIWSKAPVTYTKSPDYIAAEQEADVIIKDDDIGKLNIINVGLKEKIYVVKRLLTLIRSHIDSRQPMDVEIIRAFFNEKYIAAIVHANRDSDNILSSTPRSKEMHDAIMNIIEHRKPVNTSTGSRRKLF